MSKNVTISSSRTLAAGLTTLAAPVSLSLSGTVTQAGKGTLFAAVAAPAGIGVTLVNDSTITVAGTFTQTYAAKSNVTANLYPSALNLYGGGDTLVNNGVILASSDAELLKTAVSGTTTYSYGLQELAIGVAAQGGLIDNDSAGFIKGTQDGIYLGGSGTETVQNFGTIAGLKQPIQDFPGKPNGATTTFGGGYGDGIDIYGKSFTSVIDNSGRITGGFAVYVDTKGATTITNSGSGVIAGSAGTGVGGGNAAAIYQASDYKGKLTVVNFGTIEGIQLNPGTSLALTRQIDGIQLYQGAVTNMSTGLITGYSAGFTQTTVYNSTLVNAGRITGTGRNAYGVVMYQGQVSNSGVISATLGSASTGVALDAYGTLANSGTIIGGGYGVDVASAGQMISNTGTIIGGVDGVLLTNGGTIDDSGAIIGSGTGRAIGLGAGTGYLVLHPGARINGKVVGNSQYLNVLELATGAGAGSLNMGGSFSGITDIQFDSGTSWTLGGTAAELAAGETIAGFGQGDTLVLSGVTASTGTFVAGTGLELGNGGGMVTLDIAGNFPSSAFIIGNHSGATTIALSSGFTVGPQVTLAKATPNVTLTGSITGNGPAGTFAVMRSNKPLYAAVFGKAGTDFTVHSTAFIAPEGAAAAGGVGILLGSAGSLVNSGTIEAANGVYLLGTQVSGQAGLVDNLGSIIAWNNGVVLDSGTDALTNTGYIGAQGAFGAYLFNTGSVTNAAGATIAARQGTGVALNAAGLLSNQGVILGDSAGVAMGRYLGQSIQTAGTVLNGATGSISATGDGVVLFDAETVVNAGFIGGGTAGAAIDFKVSDSRLVVDPGARFQGTVIADTTLRNTLEFAAGASVGRLNLGGTFSGFTMLEFDAKASWGLEGNIAELAAGQTIAGFAATDSIVLDGFAASSDTYVSGKGLELVGGAGTLTLDITGSLATSGFHVTHGTASTTIALAAAGSNVTLSKPSFIAAGATASASTMALAAGQTLHGSPGGTLVGAAVFGDVFEGTSAEMMNDVLKNFGGSDMIYLTDLNPATAKLTYRGIGSSGVLTLKDGVHSTSINMVGNFSQTLFAVESFGTGSEIIYK